MGVIALVRVYLGVARGRFLLLSVCCFVLGMALVLQQRPVSPALLAEAFLVLLAAVAANASVNALNEYCDFRSGLDQLTERTPFSGGSGTLQASPQHPGAALWGGIAGLLLCSLIGLYFMLLRPDAAVSLLLAGLAGLLLILVYTPWLTRHPWLCLPAPGAGFGLLMLPGIQLALAGSVQPGGWVAGGVMFLLCNNLLLLNQVPDIAADRQVGRLTLPMLLGWPGSLRVLLVQWLLACALLLGGFCHGEPAGLILGWLAAPLMGWLVLRLRCAVPGTALFLRCMGVNVMLTLLMPLLLATGITLLL